MKRIFVILALMTALCACAQAEIYMDQQPPADWENKDLFEWTIFDVNEGDAMLLTCGGESMMVDGGPKPFREYLRDEMDARGLRHMTRMFNTHYHDDHIDGLYYLLKYGFTADEYVHSYSASAIESSELGKRTYNAAKKNQVPVNRVANGDTMTLGSAQIEVFQCTEFLNTNARSLVLRVTFGQSSILLCADIIGDVQRYFIKNMPEGAMQADIIKMPHHALTPAVPEFLDMVSPGAAVVTNRSYNVPRASSNQLSGRGIPAKYSGDGEVFAVTDGIDWYIWQNKQK